VTDQVTGRTTTRKFSELKPRRSAEEQRDGLCPAQLQVVGELGDDCRACPP
jgi:hypothetical protein